MVDHSIPGIRLGTVVDQMTYSCIVGIQTSEKELKEQIQFDFGSFSCPTCRKTT